MILRVNEYDWCLNNDIIVWVMLFFLWSFCLILGIFLVKNCFMLERRVGSKFEMLMVMFLKIEWKYRVRMSSRVFLNEVWCNSVVFIFVWFFLFL